MIALAFVLLAGLILLANIVSKSPKGLAPYLGLLLLLTCLWAFAGALFILAPVMDLADIVQEPPPPIVGWLFLGSALLSALVLFEPIRQLVSRIIPFDPQLPVQFTAVWLAILLLAWSAINLILVGGVDGLEESADAVPVTLVVVQGVGFVLIAVLGVGAFVRRSWSELVERLGLSRPSWQGLAVGALSVIFLLMVNFVISFTWALLDPDQSSALGRVTEALFGDFDTFLPIVILAIVSSISEEILFRGALQPRLGLPLTSLLFASVHMQYALTPATLAVLIIGVVLGLLRRHFGTWAAILAHFSYNFTLLLLGLLANQLLDFLETAVL